MVAEWIGRRIEDGGISGGCVCEPGHWSDLDTVAEEGGKNMKRPIEETWEAWGA